MKHLLIAVAFVAATIGLGLTASAAQAKPRPYPPDKCNSARHMKDMPCWSWLRVRLEFPELSLSGT